VVLAARWFEVMQTHYSGSVVVAAFCLGALLAVALMPSVGNLKLGYGSTRDSSDVLEEAEPSTTQERAKISTQAVSKSAWIAFKARNALVKTDAETLRTYNELLRSHGNIFGFGDDGREILDAELRRLAGLKNEVVVLEVGVWLGKSSVRWAKVNERVRVIGIDPFLHPQSGHKLLEKVPDELKDRFGQPEFNRGLAEHVTKSKGVQERVAFVTGFSPKDLVEPVFKNSIASEVAIIYIDGGKQKNYEAVRAYAEESLAMFAKHLPNAMLSGDDWNHPDNKGMEDAVREYVKKNSLKLQTSGRTWLVHPAEKAE